jgi:hypothetical protein
MARAQWTCSAPRWKALLCCRFATVFGNASAAARPTTTTTTTTVTTPRTRSSHGRRCGWGGGLSSSRTAAIITTTTSALAPLVGDRVGDARRCRQAEEICEAGGLVCIRHVCGQHEQRSCWLVSKEGLHGGVVRVVVAHVLPHVCRGRVERAVHEVPLEGGPRHDGMVVQRGEPLTGRGAGSEDELATCCGGRQGGGGMREREAKLVDECEVMDVRRRRRTWSRMRTMAARTDEDYD